MFENPVMPADNAMRSRDHENCRLPCSLPEPADWDACTWLQISPGSAPVHQRTPQVASHLGTHE